MHIRYKFVWYSELFVQQLPLVKGETEELVRALHNIHEWPDKRVNSGLRKNSDMSKQELSGLKLILTYFYNFLVAA